VDCNLIFHFLEGSVAKVATHVRSYVPVASSFYSRDVLMLTVL
jgi:hypothetical protein